MVSTARAESTGHTAGCPFSEDLGSTAHWTVEPLADVPHPWSSRITPGQVIPAVVPGQVHLDLLRAGVIPDPYDGDNENLLSWIGTTPWRYRAQFDLEPIADLRHDLVCDGLDTTATITLNGHLLGTAANQHRTHRFDASALLVSGTNELVVDFTAPLVALRRAEERLGRLPHVTAHPFNAVRTMACNAGWDWGIAAPGAGIWQGIRVESWATARIAAVRPLAGLDGSDGVLDTTITVERSSTKGPCGTATVTVDGHSTTVPIDGTATEIIVEQRIPHVRPWWPHTHGDQPLYDVTVRVEIGDAHLDWHGRVGFRDIRAVINEEAHGTGFGFEVNGEPVYIRGANWIPPSTFLSSVTPLQLRAGVLDAMEAGMNLLRIWGGGVHAPEALLRLCDELGVLVWQDFMFACAAYSEAEELWREVEAEAREAVTRLSQHACLALWNGSNENIWGMDEWGWRPGINGRPWGEAYYQDLLPRIVAELDPRTSYVPSSPYSFDHYRHPNDPVHGTMHIWDVWNEVDYTAYRSYEPRFVSEFGFQGPPAWSTLTSVVHDEPLDPNGPQLLIHQKAIDGNAKLLRGLGDHLPAPRNIDDWHWATQLNQARAVAYGIEHFRSLFPTNQGAVVWQLNDSWPVISWSAVDHLGIRKPLWYALRRTLRDRLLTFQPRGDHQVLVVHNDSGSVWRTTFHFVRASTTTPRIMASTAVAATIAPRSLAELEVPEDILLPDGSTQEYVSVSADDLSAFWYAAEDPLLHLAHPVEAMEVFVLDGGRTVKVTAHSLVKDLALFPDRLDPKARVDSGLVTLPAGRTHNFRVVTDIDLPAAALRSSPVLRCANDLVQETRG